MLRVNYFQLVIRYSIIPNCQLILWPYEEERSGCGVESYFVMATYGNMYTNPDIRTPSIRVGLTRIIHKLKLTP